MRDYRWLERGLEWILSSEGNGGTDILSPNLKAFKRSHQSSERCVGCQITYALRMLFDNAKNC